MSTTLEKVQKLTKPVVNALAQEPGVVGILCFGSYALDLYDAQSDIDLYVLCEPALLDEATRGQLFRNIPGVTALQLHQSHAGWANQWSPQADRLLLNEMPIELSYQTKGWLMNIVHQVITAGAITLPELSFRPYTMLGLLANAIVLYDPDAVIAQLQACLFPYPAQLKANLLHQNMAILTEWLVDLQECAQREFGAATFLFYLWHLCDALETVLFAINETYDPATKRAEQILKKLAHLPANFMSRYAKVLEGPFTLAGQRAAASELAKLIEETKQLLPVHLKGLEPI